MRTCITPRHSPISYPFQPQDEFLFKDTQIKCQLSVKSVKLPFVTKNSKHLVGKGAENLLALIEFTPL